MCDLKKNIFSGASSELAFKKKTLKNPSCRVVSQLGGFIRNNGFVVQEDGNIEAWVVMDKSDASSIKYSTPRNTVLDDGPEESYPDRNWVCHTFENLSVKGVFPGEFAYRVRVNPKHVVWLGESVFSVHQFKVVERERRNVPHRLTLEEQNFLKEIEFE